MHRFNNPNDSCCFLGHESTLLHGLWLVDMPSVPLQLRLIHAASVFLVALQHCMHVLGLETLRMVAYPLL